MLTDFGFFEEESDIIPLLDELLDHHITYLGAYHGYVTQRYKALFSDRLGGQTIELKNMKELPGILVETIEQMADME